MFFLFLAQVIFNEIDAKIGQIVCLIVPCEINETGIYNRLLEISVIMPI